MTSDTSDTSEALDAKQKDRLFELVSALTMSAIERRAENNCSV
jgi:hypothetical protein